MDNKKGIGGFCGLLAIGGIAVAMLVGGTWVLMDGTNADYIAPMPTPYHDDTNSDIMTIAEPDELTPELAEVAVMDEVTDLARDVSDNQLAQARDATGAIAGVAVAGYAANTAIVSAFSVRDIMLMIGAIVMLFLVWKIKAASNDKK